MEKVNYLTFVERRDVVEFKLENGDRVFMTIPQYEHLTTSEINDIDASLVYNGLEHQYTVVLSESEYSDELPEIIGFQKLV